MKNSGLLVEMFKLVTGIAPIVPSTTTPDYVSLKNYQHFTAIITVKNATTVTGSAITLKQATAVAGTGEKALAFTSMWGNVDTGASDTLVKTAVTSNTFTTDDTNSKDLKYVVEVDASQLDVAGGFDCIRVGTDDATAATLNVEYLLSNARYAQATPPSAIVD